MLTISFIHIQKYLIHVVGLGQNLMVAFNCQLKQ